jgi:hypothetical protein
VPLNNSYPLAVTFIVEPRLQDDGTTERRHRSRLAPASLSTYPAESRACSSSTSLRPHVISGERETHVRIGTRDGGSRVLRIREWVHHPRADVAAASLPNQGYDDLHLLNIPAASLQWARIGEWRPFLGDRVHFVGLLALPRARDMTEKNVPMVRSGTIGALYQEHVPVQWPGGSIRKVQAHLIDCRSYGGFSGAPCFFQRDDQPTGVSERQGRQRSVSRTPPRSRPYARL